MSATLSTQPFFHDKWYNDWNRRRLSHFFLLYCWILFSHHNSIVVVNVFNVVKGLWIQNYLGITPIFVLSPKRSSTATLYLERKYRYIPASTWVHLRAAIGYKNGLYFSLRSTSLFWSSGSGNEHKKKIVAEYKCSDDEK